MFIWRLASAKKPSATRTSQNPGQVRHSYNIWCNWFFFLTLFSFDFTGPPAFQMPPPAALQVKEMTTATLTCVASAEPLPTISWQFNGAPLANGTRSGRVTYTSSSSVQFQLTSVLTITAADYNIDRGQYTCVAQNNQGVINTNSTLDVWSKFVFSCTAAWLTKLRSVWDSLTVLFSLIFFPFFFFGKERE